MEDALFEVARGEHERDGLQAALAALGGVAAWLATSRKARQREGRENVAPPPRLGSHWVRAADDGSPEFRVAAALASLGWPATDGTVDPHATVDAEDDDEPPRSGADADDEDDGGDGADAAAEGAMPGAPVRRRESDRESEPPMAAHFAPVDGATITRRFRRWAANDPPGVVWGAGGLVRNMIAVLERRLVEHARHAFTDKALGAASPARLADVLAFLEGPPAFDDARCAALLAGLVWARPARLRRRPHVVDVEARNEAIPFAYAALKPLFTPDDALRAPQGSDPDAQRRLPPHGTLPIPPGIVARIRRGAIGEAVRIALARARASGIASPFDPGGPAAKGVDFGAAVASERLAAALLVPIDNRALNSLLERAYPLKDDGPRNETDPSTEDADDAA